MGVGSENEEYDATASIPEPIHVDSWHYAVGTFDGSNKASLYIDGKLGASFRATLSYGPDPLLVGAYTNRPWNFSGLMSFSGTTHWTPMPSSSYTDPARATIAGLVEMKLLCETRI